MFRFSPRQLEVFQMVCRMRSFRLAAEMMRISQASVSEQIRSLEEQIGTSLFFRRPGRPVEITSEGERFLDGVGEFVERGRALGQMFRHEPTLPIRTFIGVSLFEHLVRPALPAFMAENTDIRLDFVNPELGYDINNAVRNGLVDCALLSQDAASARGEYIAINTESSYIFADRALRDKAKGCGLSSIPYVTWDIPPVKSGDILRLLASVGVMHPNILTEVQHHEVAVRLACEGKAAIVVLQSTIVALDKERKLVPVLKLGNWERRLYLSPRLDLRVRARLGDFFLKVAG